MSSLAPSIVEMNNAAYMTAIANQRERIASLEAERDQLRAERDQLRIDLDDEIAERDTLRAEVERLQGAITGFCQDHKWAADAWKNTKHTKPLFDITHAIEAAKESK